MSEDKKTILIVDDEQELREAIENILTEEGYNVLTASDGEEGLAKALENKPDLMFLDILMPKLDGVEVLKKLREDEWGRDAQVITMTVLDDIEKIAEVVEAGGNEYILKSEITLKGIVDKVKERLGT